MPKILMIDAAAVLCHFQNLKAFGVPAQALEKALGMSQKDLQIRDARVPIENNLRMIEKGRALVGPDVVLRLGSAVSPQQLGVCGHIFLNCQNMAEVEALFLRYQRLLYAISSFRTDNTPHRSMLKHTIENPMFRKYNRLSVELAFSSIVTVIRKLTEDEINPIEVRFTHERPSYVSAYKNIFRAPLLFNQKEDMLVYPNTQMDKPISKTQEYVKDILMQHANGLLQDLQKETGLKNDVKKVVMLNLPKGNVDIEMVSEKLNMSRWTLTRKLRKEGTTFRNFVTDLKKELSLSLLQNEKLSIGEIAFLLGYSEISAFRRAFKDWTSKNPSRYRQEFFS